MRIRGNLGGGSANARTLRDMSGGLNTQDSEWVLSSKYATRLRNFIVGDDGSIAVRSAYRNFTNANATIESNQAEATESDWGVYNTPLTFGASASISSTNTEKWITVDCDAAHGLVTGNWIKGITDVAAGDLGGVPYTEFNSSQWRCVDVVDATTFRVRVNTGATSTASITTLADTLYCNKTALMLPVDGTFTERSLGFVNGQYFNNFLILVDRVGVVYKVSGSGVISIIHNDVIAAAESGAPRGWRPLADNGTLITFVSMTVFKGTMQLHNGLDKPLEVYDDAGVIKCRYLVDAGTGVNTNTPIAKFSTVVNTYVCLAGQPLDPKKVSISAARAGGTFVGDAAPNDATEIFIDEYSEISDSIITGISSYRGRLIVLTANAALVFRLGEYDADSNHVPRYEETIYDFGTRSPRSIVRMTDNLMVLGDTGIVGVRQARLTNVLEMITVSDVVRDQFSQLLAKDSNQLLVEEVFAIIDRRNRMVITSVPRTTSIYTANTECSLHFEESSTRIEIRFSLLPDIDVGDTVTLYDFSPTFGVSLTPVSGYTQYKIIGKSDDDLSVFINAGSVPTQSGAYSTVVGYAAVIIAGDDNQSFINEQSNTFLAFKQVVGTKLSAWQELDGLNKYGTIRDMVVSELNNLFLIYDYFVMVINYNNKTETFDGAEFLGQNVHAGALTYNSSKHFHAGRTYFDPAEAIGAQRCIQHQIIDEANDLNDAIATNGDNWDSIPGVPIEFEYVSPWIDFGDRRSEKAVRFIGLDTHGTGVFTIEAFADGVYANEFGQLVPVASLRLLAGDYKNHHIIYTETNKLYIIKFDSIISGKTLISQVIEDAPVIDGIADNQQLHGFNINFRTLRIRISGNTAHGSVRIAGISLWTSEGALVGA